MRKRSCFIALILVFAVLFSTVSCSYRPASSTKEEKTVVFTVDSKYEVPYEFYRFVYLAERDRAIASGEDASFAALDAAVRREISRVYAMYSLCEQYGIDSASRAVEKEINAEVKALIKDKTDGFGSRRAYLDSLAANHMNDSVFRFYLRYNACEKYLAQAMYANSFVPEDDASIRAYYLSDETVCATWIYIPASFLSNYTDAMRADLIANAKAADNAAFIRMTHEYYQPLYSDEALETGFYFGRYQMSDEYSDLTDAAFALQEGETSSLVYSGEGAYIIRRLPKDVAYLEREENDAYLRECYLLNAFYQVLEKEAARLLPCIEGSAFYASLNGETVG